MGERYQNWIEILANRDQALASVFVLACLLVAGWLIVGSIDDSKLRQRLQGLFVAGGLTLFYGSLLAVVLLQ